MWRLRHELSVIPNASGDVQVAGRFPAVFDEAGDVLVPEVIGSDVGDGIVDLSERAVSVAAVNSVDVLYPVGECGRLATDRRGTGVTELRPAVRD